MGGSGFTCPKRPGEMLCAERAGISAFQATRSMLCAFMEWTSHFRKTDSSSFHRGQFLMGFASDMTKLSSSFPQALQWTMDVFDSRSVERESVLLTGLV